MPRKDYELFMNEILKNEKKNNINKNVIRKTEILIESDDEIENFSDDDFLVKNSPKNRKILKTSGKFNNSILNDEEMLKEIDNQDFNEINKIICEIDQKKISGTDLKKQKLGVITETSLENDDIQIDQSLLNEIDEILKKDNMFNDFNYK